MRKPFDGAGRVQYREEPEDAENRRGSAAPLRINIGSQPGFTNYGVAKTGPSNNMLNFRCLCGNTLYFENTRCVRCERELGFVPANLMLSAIEPRDNNHYEALQIPGKPAFRLCANYSAYHVCNWLVPVTDTDEYCFSCRFTSVIPNLDTPGNVEKWANIAAAKRRLFFTLMRLGLPLRTKAEEPERGLDFQLLEDKPGTPPGEHVFTGHSDGIITLNIVEADDAAREKLRIAMHEPYRTLLGHLRHEIGHYYWSLLVDQTDWWPRFSELFGDSGVDYGVALQTYHANGPAPDWPQRFVSAYATCHPWEDWAETWAHYLHIYDTLETAEDLGLTGRTLRIPAGVVKRTEPFGEMISAWESLSVVMNCLNRSLGQRDAYPFVIAKPVVDKLAFIHELVLSAGQPKNSKQS